MNRRAGAENPAGNFERGRGLSALSTAHVHAFDLLALERFLHPADGHVGIIAVVTEVTENDVMKILMSDGFHELSDLIIGKMAMPGADALLGGPGSFRVCFEQARVVIGLDEEGVCTLKAVFDEARDEPDIAQDPELGLGVLNHKAHGVHCIMGHGKALDLEVLKVEGAARLHEVPARLATGVQAAHHGLLCQRCAEHRDGVFSAQDINAARVISMLMAQENAVN